MALRPSPPRRADARADAGACARIVRAHARTFAAASRFLPPAKRRATFALYAFCRLADDLVDLDAAGAPAAEAARRLADYERRLGDALAGRPDGPVFRELAEAVAAYDVPHAVLHELLAGIACDLRPTRYATWDELESYCEGVASTVGEMCTHVFGVPGGAEARMRALRYARTLGVAMQLTNILRDVGEDARRGRCYLPAEELAMFGIDPSEVLRDPALGRDERWRPFMAFMVGRARSLYEAAVPGIALLAADARRCATASARGYAGILDAIAGIGYDTVATRARVSPVARAALLWRVWRERPPAADDLVVGDGPRLRWRAAPTHGHAAELAKLA